MAKEIEVLGLANDKPVIDANQADECGCQIPWDKLSAKCTCGSNYFKLYDLGVKFDKACLCCGLISSYLKEALLNPQNKKDAADKALAVALRHQAVSHQPDK